MLAAPFGGILLGRFPWMRFITLDRQSHVLEEMITGGSNWGGVQKGSVSQAFLGWRVGTSSHYLRGFSTSSGGCLGFLNHQQ